MRECQLVEEAITESTKNWKMTSSHVRISFIQMRYWSGLEEGVLT